ncbi:hypothetical protein HYS54_05020 [Candidatus Micrarchaeota archaeon]|nr:hypothetical protein [Candidatus Micrarchaeota archaeon]
MDDRGQVSLEYLAILALAIAIAAVAVLLLADLFNIKDGLKQNVQLLRKDLVG